MISSGLESGPERVNGKKVMTNYFEKREHWKEDRKPYYRQKTNLRLKYAALTSISISIILLVSMIFLLDNLSDAVYLFLRGCTGLFALIFGILIAILEYRVNAAFFKNKNRGRNNDRCNK